jgi:hypothetical protein
VIAGDPDWCYASNFITVCFAEKTSWKVPLTNL